MRKLQVVAQGEAPDGDQIEEAIDCFNDMLHGWKILGVDVEHTTQEPGDTFALGDEFIEGTVYVLASRMSPNYQVPPAFDMDGWWRAIQAAYMTIDAVTFDAGLLNLPSQRYRRFL